MQWLQIHCFRSLTRWIKDVSCFVKQLTPPFGDLIRMQFELLTQSANVLSSLKAAKATLALNSELKTRHVRRPDDLLMMIS